MPLQTMQLDWTSLSDSSEILRVQAMTGTDFQAFPDKDKGRLSCSRIESSKSKGLILKWSIQALITREPSLPSELKMLILLGSWID
jgi:hypothetical protein